MKTLRFLIVLIVSFSLSFGSAFGQTTPTPVVPTVPAPTTAPTVKKIPALPSASIPSVSAIAPVNLLPPQIVALGSEEELFSYVMSTSSVVEVQMNAQTQVGGYVSKTIRLPGSATLPAITKALQEANLQLKLYGVSEVGYWVSVHDANYAVSLYGYDSKTPVVSAGGFEKLNFNVGLSLSYETTIQWKNLQSVKVTTFDDQGVIRNSYYLNVDSNGFRIESGAAGKVKLEVTDSTGISTVYDLRKSALAKIDTVATGATVSAYNVVSITDKDQLILVPDTNGGVGSNVLGEVILTKVTDLKVAGRTIENKNATSFKFRQIDSPTDTGWQAPVQADSNGLATIKLSAGTWHVIAIFPDNALRPYQFYGNSGGGKG